MATRKRSDRVKPSNVVATARGSSRKRANHGALWENAKSLLGALLVFLVIRAFLLEAFRIPSGSMEPTLLVGDFLFVNKLVFGPRIPFTSVHLPAYGEPERNDVVVYTSPYQQDQPEDPTPTVVKRIVGVGNDTLYMRNGVLHMNGIAQREGYGTLDEGMLEDEPSPAFEWQNQFALRSSRFGAAPAAPTHDNWGPFVVPAGHFFTLGDSRYNSKDARYYGFVPRRNLRGRPLFVYYSYDALGSDTAVPWITDIRWGRIGHWIR